MNNIIETIESEKQTFFKSLITPENLSNSDSRLRFIIMMGLMGLVPFISLTAWAIIGSFSPKGSDAYLIQHILPFFLQAYTPAVLFLLFSKKTSISFAKKRLKNKSEDELLKEIEKSFTLSFDEKNISESLHDQVKIALSMDEYKSLCLSSENIPEITYGHLSSFINNLETLKEHHKLIENNKLSISSESEIVKNNQKENITVLV